MSEGTDQSSWEQAHRMVFTSALNDAARAQAKGNYHEALGHCGLASGAARKLGKAEQQQARYSELYVFGDICRTRHNAWDALRFYRKALQIGGPHDITIQQMMAVSYSMVHRHKDAAWWLKEALRQLKTKLLQGATPQLQQLRGAILRDLGKTQSEQGQYDEADGSFVGSLLLLAEVDSERGATHHFWAMSYFRRGEADKALEHFEQAYALTTDAYRLYALLNHAMVLITFDQRTDANLLLDEAVVLAAEHGSWVHRLRIKALRRGIVGAWAWQAAQPALQWSQRAVATLHSLTPF